MSTRRRPKQIYSPEEAPHRAPVREVIPVPADELERLRSTDARLDVVEVKVDVLGEGQERIEGKLDEKFDVLLKALIDDRAASRDSNPLKNTNVQVILAVAFLIVIGAAVGKDFVLDTPAVDVTTSESP